MTMPIGRLTENPPFLKYCLSKLTRNSAIMFGSVGLAFAIDKFTEYHIDLWH